MDQSKRMFKVVVGVFGVEWKYHGGAPQLSYNKGAGKSEGAPYVIFQQIAHGNAMSES